MSKMIQRLSAEFLKTKRTFCLWFTIFGAGFIPIFLIVMYLHNSQHLVPKQNENPWTYFLSLSWNGTSFLLIPFFIVLLSTMVFNIENRNGGWKLLFTLPINKSEIYIGKLVVIISYLLCFYLMYTILLFGAGIMLGLIHPKFGFLNYAPDLDHYTLLFLKSFISSLSLVAINYWLCFRIPNLVAPIGITVFGIILFIAIFQGKWGGILFFPFAFPYLSVNPPPFLHYSANNLFTNHEVLAAGYFFIFAAASFFDFTRIFRG